MSGAVETLCDQLGCRDEDAPDLRQHRAQDVGVAPADDPYGTTWRVLETGEAIEEDTAILWRGLTEHLHDLYAADISTEGRRRDLLVELGSEAWTPLRGAFAGDLVAFQALPEVATLQDLLERIEVRFGTITKFSIGLLPEHGATPCVEVWLEQPYDLTASRGGSPRQA